MGKIAVSIGRDQFSFILDMTIETSARQWDYAVTADAHIKELRKMPARSQLVVEMLIEVSAGAIGVAWLSNDNKLVAIERTVRSNRDPQQVFALAPCEQAHCLMIRNVAPEDHKSVFTVRGFKVTAIFPGYLVPAFAGAD